MFRAGTHLRTGFRCTVIAYCSEQHTYLVEEIQDCNIRCTLRKLPQERYADIHQRKEEDCVNDAERTSKLDKFTHYKTFSYKLCSDASVHSVSSKID